AMSQLSSSLVENNILNDVQSPIIMEAGSTGNVISYNFENFVSSSEGGIQPHSEGNAVNLYEGNRTMKFWADDFHGTSHLNTVFRNNTYSGVGVDLMSYNRWWNLIGNVINATTYKSTPSDATLYDRFSGVAFRLGYSDVTATNGPSVFFYGGIN